MHHSRIFFILFLLAVLYFMPDGPALYAQNESGEKSASPATQIFGTTETREPSLLEKSLKLIPQQIIPMEGFIDTLAYKVGPGDILLINLWGEVEENAVVSVYPQGNIIIPTLGSIDVQGLTLAEVARRVQVKIGAFYPSSIITTSLYQVRKIVVHVTGEVQQAGNIIVTPVHRVAEALKMAGGVSNWADKRDIQVTHRDGAAEKFDLFDYEREGDLTRNPLVQGGDVIYVPRLTLTGGRVFVEGNVPNPGYYQFYMGETMAEFLRRIQLQRETTDWEQAYLERFDSTGTTDRIDLPAEIGQSGDTPGMPNRFNLMDGDRLFLPKKIDQVFVQGAVMKPGSYPFAVKMRAIDYVGMAGRYDRSGGIENIKVIRREDGTSLSGGDVILERGDIVVVPLKKTEKLLEYLDFIAPVTSLIITAAAVGIITK